MVSGEASHTLRFLTDSSLVSCPDSFPPEGDCWAQTTIIDDVRLLERRPTDFWCADLPDVCGGGGCTNADYSLFSCDCVRGRERPRLRD